MRFLDKDWYGQPSDIVMKQALLIKFEIPKFKKFLKDSGDQSLVEANKFDLYFGIGLSPSDPKALDQKQWRGRNVLGNLLMEVREQV